MADKRIIIGIGENLRGDDAAGLLVVDRLENIAGLPPMIKCSSDPGTIVEVLGSVDYAVIVDAVQTGRAAPGTVHVWDVSKSQLPDDVHSCSTHAVGLAKALALSKALGDWPDRVVIYGIEATDFSFREGPSPAVLAGTEQAANQIRKDLIHA